MWNKLQSYLIVAFIGAAVVLVATLLVLAGDFHFLIKGILLILTVATLITAFWSLNFIFFQRPRINIYEVKIVRRDNKLIDVEKANYLLKNILFKTALRFPNKRFGLLITKGENPPYFVTEIRDESLQEVIGAMTDFHEYIIRLDEPEDTEVHELLRGRGKRFVLASVIKEIEADAENISLSDLLSEQSGCDGVMLTAAFLPKLEKETLLGNLVFIPSEEVSASNKDQNALAAKIATGAAVAHIERTMVSGNPFMRFYGLIRDFLITVSLTDNVIKKADVVKFEAIRNTDATGKNSFPKHENSERDNERWIVANSGLKGAKAPVLLRKSSLVLQNTGGINPAVGWASFMLHNPYYPFIMLDFEGNSAMTQATNEDLMQSQDLLHLKIPSETPEILNLLSIWHGITPENYNLMTGLFLAYLNKMVKYIFPQYEKINQDKIAAVLQAVMLIPISNKVSPSIADLIGLADISTPVLFLDTLHDLMNNFVYNHTPDSDFAQIQIYMDKFENNPIDYEQTIANHVPDVDDIHSFNELISFAQRFISEPSNLVISQSESVNNISNYQGIIFDVSGWAGGKEDSFFLEYLLLSSMYIQKAKELLGHPTVNLLINGLSTVPPENAASVIGIVDDYLADPTGYVLLSDTTSINEYATWFKNRKIIDLYTFRMRDLGFFEELYNKFALGNSVFYLPRIQGYLIRTLINNEKRVILMPANVITGKPTLTNVTKSAN